MDTNPLDPTQFVVSSDEGLGVSPSPDLTPLEGDVLLHSYIITFYVTEN